jgi:hypothetical protein
MGGVRGDGYASDVIRSGGSRLSEQQEVEGELKVKGRPGFELLYYESRSQNDIDDDDHRSCSENTPVLIAMADGDGERILSLLSVFCFGSSFRYPIQGSTR